MKIGNIKIHPTLPLFLGPMAGYTNIAYRQAMIDLKADGTYTELASASALCRISKTISSNKTLNLIKTPKNGVNAIQIFGNDEIEISDAIKFIDEKLQSNYLHAKFIDINLGCPANKVTKIGAGSALLHSPSKLKKIFDLALKSTDYPITAKIRLLGKLKDSLKIATLLQKCGVGALAVHGRSASQKYSGESNWEKIKHIKSKLDIPIIANGDVKTYKDVKKMQQVTNADAVMISRASLKNPFIFIQSKNYLSDGKDQPQITPAQKCDFFKRYLTYHKKNNLSFVYAKDIALKLSSYLRGASIVRNKISKSTTLEELEESLKC